MDTQNKAHTPRLALWTCVVVMVAIVVAVAIATAPRPVPRFHGTAYNDVLLPAAEFSLTDHNGRPVSLESYRGSPVLLFFGYTHCPDVCPLTLDRLSRAVRTAGGGAEDIRILLVTLDPARDTPAALKVYAERFGPAVVGLTGDTAALGRARKGYGAFIAERPAQAAAHAHGGHAPAPPPEVAAAMKTVHSGVVYGIDRRGNLQVVITEGAPLDKVVDDVRTLSRL